MTSWDSKHACFVWLHNTRLVIFIFQIFSTNRFTLQTKACSVAEWWWVSSYHRSTWREEKVLRAASRVKSLKPHCVSLTPLTQKNQTRKWKPYIRNVRITDRCGRDIAVVTELLRQIPTIVCSPRRQQKTITWATDSFSRWALEPQDIAMLS